jgi:hypothetical protein
MCSIGNDTSKWPDLRRAMFTVGCNKCKTSVPIDKADGYRAVVLTSVVPPLQHHQSYQAQQMSSQGGQASDWRPSSDQIHLCPTCIKALKEWGVA